MKFANQGYKTVLVDLDPHQAEATQPGSLDNIERAEHEFNELSNNIFISTLAEYQSATGARLFPAEELDS